MQSGVLYAVTEMKRWRPTRGQPLFTRVSSENAVGHLSLTQFRPIIQSDLKGGHRRPPVGDLDNLC